MILNPHDEAPVKLALRLKAAHGARITALSMGPKRTEGLMRYLILGLTAVCFSIPAFAGSDTLATSTVLAAAVRFLGMPDLLCSASRVPTAIRGGSGRLRNSLASHPFQGFRNWFCRKVGFGRFKVL